MLMRFDPFRELDRLADELTTSSRTGSRSFPMDAFRRGEEFIVQFYLPGVDPQSVELTVERNVLTVKADRAFDRQEGDELLVAERPEGTFARQLFLGDTLDADNVAATYENGVLTLTIPVAERAKPRRVEISPRGGGEQIEARGASGPAEAQSEGQALPG